MGRTRGKSLLAERVWAFLTHVHGVAPAYLDDLRHADRGEWDAPVGGHRVTPKGNPSPAEPLGDHDGRSVDLDGSDDYLTAPDSSDLDFGVSDSFSLLTFFRADSVDGSSPSSVGRPLAKRNLSTNEGYLIYGRPQIYIGDGSNSIQRTGPGSGNYSDGDLVYFAGVCDRGVNELRAIDPDGMYATDCSSVGALENSHKVYIGSDDGGAYASDLSFGLICIHPEWITEQQSAYIYTLLRDRTVDVPDLPIYGTPETGFKRRLPSYLTDAFGADGPDFWWAADRHYHHDPSTDPAVTQLPNFAGSGSVGPAVQRTGNAKANITGGGYGEPADALGFGGDDYYAHQGYTQDAQTVTWAYRLTQGSGQSGTVYVASHYDGGTAEISLEYDATNNRYAATIVDGSGTTVTLTDTTSGIDPTSGYHTVSLRVDASGDHALRVDGTEVDADATAIGDMTASTRQAGARNGGSAATQDVREIIQSDTALSDAALAALEGSL